MPTKCIFLSWVGDAINRGLSHRSSCPCGQECSLKSAPQHVQPVIGHFDPEKY